MCRLFCVPSRPGFIRKSDETYRGVEPQGRQMYDKLQFVDGKRQAKACPTSSEWKINPTIAS